MAEYVSMKQVPGGTVTAVDDRILNDINLSNGKIYGCDVAYIGNNMIHINAGYGIIKGGLFEIEDHTEYVEYAESEPTTGQIYLKFDASATDKLVIVKETTADLHVLVQNEDANFESGVYEIPICSFVATTTTLENVVETWPTASGAMETLATMEALMANTTPGKVADALLTKQINTNLVTEVDSISVAFNFVYNSDDESYGFLDKDGEFMAFNGKAHIPFNFSWAKSTPGQNTNASGNGDFKIFGAKVKTICIESISGTMNLKYYDTNGTEQNISYALNAEVTLPTNNGIHFYGSASGNPNASGSVKGYMIL